MENSITQDNGLIYLNHAAIGPMPKSAYERYIHQIKEIETKGEFGLDLELHLELWEDIRHKFSRLINGKPEGVTITFNTASALHIVADGLSHLYGPSKNIVITDIEFTTNSYVWQRIAKRYKMELRVVEFTGAFSFDSQIDENTVLVSVSFVQFSNGYKADLRQISNLCHSNDAFLVVDAIQGLGAVPFDVNELGVDFIAAGAYKWMLGPMGTGFFYCRPELLAELDSVLIGWFGDKEFRHMTHHKLDPWDDARVYQQAIMPQFSGLRLSLEQILEWEVEKTYTHIKSLIDYLASSLQDSPYKLMSSMEPMHRSGIVKLDHSNAEEIVNNLKKQYIVTSYRDGGIRVSPHRYNTVDEIKILTDALLGQ